MLGIGEEGDVEPGMNISSAFSPFIEAVMVKDAILTAPEGSVACPLVLVSAIVSLAPDGRGSQVPSLFCLRITVALSMVRISPAVPSIATALAALLFLSREISLPLSVILPGPVGVCSVFVLQYANRAMIKDARNTSRVDNLIFSPGKFVRLILSET